MFGVVVGLVGRIGTGSFAPVQDAWILATGFWRDIGVWQDDDVWID